MFYYAPFFLSRFVSAEAEAARQRRRQQRRRDAEALQSNLQALSDRLIAQQQIIERLERLREADARDFHAQIEAITAQFKQARLLAYSSDLEQVGFPVTATATASAPAPSPPAPAPVDGATGAAASSSSSRPVGGTHAEPSHSRRSSRQLLPSATDIAAATATANGDGSRRGGSAGTLVVRGSGQGQSGGLDRPSRLVAAAPGGVATVAISTQRIGQGQGQGGDDGEEGYKDEGDVLHSQRNGHLDADGYADDQSAAPLRPLPDPPIPIPLSRPPSLAPALPQRRPPPLPARPGKETVLAATATAAGTHQARPRANGVNAPAGAGIEQEAFEEI